MPRPREPSEILPLLESQRTWFAEANDDDVVQTLPLDRCLRFWVATGAARAETENARTFLAGIYYDKSLGIEVFVLCGLGISIPQLTSVDHTEAIDEIRDWWSQAEHPRSLTEAAKEYFQLCSPMFKELERQETAQRQGRPMFMESPGVPDAAMKNDLETLRAELEAGGNPNYLNNSPALNALGWAVTHGNLDMVKLLIRYGAISDWGCGDDMLLLEVAAGNGHAEIVEYLITECGVTVDYQKVFDQWETGQRSVPVITESPLESVCQLRRERSDTPCLSRLVECAEILMRHGSDVNFAHQWNGLFTPLHKAACWSLELTQCLLAHGANIHLRDEFGLTPLFAAASAGKPKIIQVLLDAGAEIGLRGVKNESLAHCAAASGCIESLDLLLAAGEILDVESESRTIPLHLAAEHGETAMVRYLLSRGRGVNASTTHKWTPLLCAARGNHVETVRVLLEAGADLTATLNYGITALHLAAAFKPDGDWQSSLPLVKLLLDHGANISAKCSGIVFHISLMMSSGYSMDMMQEEVEREIEADPSIELEDWLPIQCCLSALQLESAEFFVARGADLNVGDHRGGTLLHGALLVPEPCPDAAQFLLKHKVDPMIPDASGTTGLQALYKTLGEKRAKEMLEECGRADLAVGSSQVKNV